MITFDSIHETFMTFSADDGLEAGMVCKITDNCAVGPCQSGDSFCGVARSARLGMAGIQTSNARSIYKYNTLFQIFAGQGYIQHGHIFVVLGITLLRNVIRNLVSADYFRNLFLSLGVCVNDPDNFLFSIAHCSNHIGAYINIHREEGL